MMTSPTPQIDPVALNTSVPHPARLYDVYLGGKDNFPADRAAADQISTVFPAIGTMARENRAFMTRAVRFLAAECGIRQFLDVGTGIPTSPNLHETVQVVAPEARVVYTDNDPIVLAHARALLTSTPQGRTAYLDADLHDPASILEAPVVRDTLDLTRPVALSLVAILHFFPDDTDPYGIVRGLLGGLPAGSHLILSHATADLTPSANAAVELYRAQGIAAQTRRKAEIARFFDRLDLVHPGIQLAHRWRSDPAEQPAVIDSDVSIYAGVARKP